MTRNEVINEIVSKTGVGRPEVQATLEALLKLIKENMAQGENIYFRGFGSFILKHRRKKLARNIHKNTAVIVDAHFIPFFKPAPEFTEMIKESSELQKRLAVEAN